MLRVIPRLLLLPILLLFMAVPSLGQSIDGALSGKLVDPSGAVVAGASVKVANKTTGLSFDVSSSEQGLFRVEHLPVGKYSITTEAAGFKRVAVEITITLNAIADVIVTLEPGGVDDVVTISAGEILVETTTSTLTNSFNERKVVDLPNPSGSELNLALLAPNVTSQSGGVVGEGGSIGGNRPRNNNFTVDGVDNNDISVTGHVIDVIPEAVQEFTLLTNQFTAEFGRASAGQFNTITKSGTNEFHFEVFYDVNNKNLNALDNLTKESISRGEAPDRRPRFDFNRIGGTAGGPIIPNKLFFFGAFQYKTQGDAGAPSSFLAPTAAGFATLSTLRGVSPFSLNLLRTSVPAAGSTSDSVSVLGANIPVGTLNILIPSFINQYIYNINVDQVLGTNDQLRYRYNFDRRRQPLPGFPDVKFNGSQEIDNKLLSFIFVHTFSPNIVNELRLSYRRQEQAFAIPDAFANFPNLAIDDIGLNIGPDGNSPQSTISNNYQLVNNISFVAGKHNFKAGIDFRNIISPNNFLPRGRGEYDFASLEEFLMDVKPTGFNGGLRGVGESTFAGNQSAYYFFIQDDFHATPNLTLNMGLRYEYNGLARDERLQARNAISTVPGVLEFKVPKTDKNDFGPRIGLAYSPNYEGGIGGFLFGKNGQGSLRAGFGLAYDIIFQNLPLLQLPPQFQQELDASAGNGGVFGTPTGFLQNGGLGMTPIPPITAADARGATAGIILDHVSPYTISYTLDYQRQIGSKWSIDVRYLGTHANKQFVQVRKNGGFPPFAIAGFSLPTYLNASQVPDLRTRDGMPTLDLLLGSSIFGTGIGGLGQAGAEFGSVTAFEPVGSSVYHSGSVNLQRRFADGFTMSAAYTYSHAIDNVTNELFTSFINPRRLQNGFDPSDGRGNSALDRPNRFVVSAIYDLPFFESSTGLKKTLLAGWQVNLIYTAESGQPFTALSATDSNLNGDSAGDRALRNPNGVKNTGSGVTAIRNSRNQIVGYLANNGNAEYIQAGQGVIATAGPNTLRSPGINNFDFSVFKNFRIGETANIQFRAEFFNAFNHPQFPVGGGTVFQKLTSALNLSYANAASPSFNDERIFASTTRVINLGLRIRF